MARQTINRARFTWLWVILLSAVTLSAAIRSAQVKSYLSTVYKKAVTLNEKCAALPSGDANRAFAEKAVKSLKNEARTLSRLSANESSAQSQAELKKMALRLRRINDALDTKLSTLNTSPPAAAGNSPEDISQQIQMYTNKINELKNQLPPPPKTLTPLDSALALLKSGKARDAANRLDRLMIKHPTDDQLYYFSAQAYHDLGENTTARQALREALRIQSSKSEYWDLLGQIQVDMGDRTAAFSAFNEALMLNPGNWDSRMHIAGLLLAEGLADSAETIYLAAEKAGASLPLAYQGIARISAGRKNYERAKTYYLKALELLPQNGDLLLGLGNIYLAEKQYRYAAEYYQELLKNNPAQFDARFSLGRVWFESGDYPSAMYQWEHLYSLNENYPDIRFWLPVVYFVHGERLQQKGNYAESTRLYQKALAMNPQSQQWLSYANYILGEDARRLHNYRDAEKYLKKALEINPRSLESCFSLGMMHWDMKDYDGAREYWTYILNIDPDDANARSWLNLLKTQQAEPK